MATRGRPPKPVEVKRRLGNPGKRALPAVASVTALPMATGIPDPPGDLGLEGRDLWSRAWSAAITWVSPHSDELSLLSTCRLADDLAQARARYRATNDAKDAYLIVALSKSLMDGLAVLGFTPTARTRLGVAEVRKQNALEDLIARRQVRK